MNEIVFICAVLGLAGLIQGITGFGSALVAVPLLSMTMRIEAVVPLVLLNGLVLNYFMAFRLRKAMMLKKIVPLIIGVIPGSILGFYVLSNIDQEILKMTIGLIVMGYALYNLLPNRKVYTVSDRWGPLVGGLSGLIGTALSVGGPPVVIYATMKDWGKNEIKSGISNFFSASSLIAVIIHASGGTINGQVLKQFAFSAPFIVGGSAVGLILGDKINRQTYITLVNLVLIIVGAKLLFDFFLG